jgi:hypothetical protein
VFAHAAVPSEQSTLYSASGLNEGEPMTEQRLIVDVKDVVLRLQCRCGSAISVPPAASKESILYCTNCDTPFSDYQGPDHAGGPVTKFVRALQALVKTAKDIPPDFHIQFEIEQPTQPSR